MRLLAVIASTALVACGSSGPQLAEDHVRAVAENMATAWSDCDYVAFSRDWDDALSGQLLYTPAEWVAECGVQVLASGQFVSIESFQFLPSGAADTERWNVTIAFENETDILALVLRTDDGRVDHWDDHFGESSP